MADRMRVTSLMPASLPRGDRLVSLDSDRRFGRVGVIDLGQFASVFPTAGSYGGRSKDGGYEVDSQVSTVASIQDGSGPRDANRSTGIQPPGRAEGDVGERLTPRRPGG